MTPRDRIRAAMDLHIPDRVPVMAQLSIGHMLLQLGVPPVEFWHDGEIFANGLVRLREIYDFDGILISLHGHDPDWRRDIRMREKTSDGELVMWSDGSQMLYPFDDLPRPLTLSEPRFTLSSLKDSDLPAVLDYIPVSQGLHFRINQPTKLDIFRMVREKASEKYSVHGEVTSPFDYFLDLVGYQNGLMDMVEYPDQVKWVLSRFAVLVSQLAGEMCDTGIDAIKISSPFAGAGFISPEMYRDFIVPYESEIVHTIRKKGVHAYMHTCGSIGDRLEMMLDSGISGIECLDPPPLGNVELENAKSRIIGRGFIKGNVDSVNLLLTKGSVEILSDLRRRIEIGKQGGGYILSPACSDRKSVV